MRSEYIHILLKKIKQGDIPWVFKHALKYTALKLSYTTGKALCGPILGMIFTTFRCNLKCIMCNCYEKVQQGEEKELDTEEMLAVIDDFAAIGTSGIVFTGGEPLLREDIFTLISYSKKKRLTTYLFTNGTLLNEHKMEMLLNSGLDGINLPLDGVNADTHDKVRGKKGGHEIVINAIKRISSLREKNKKDISLSVSCVICKYNLEEIVDLVSFIADLGIDHINFTPMQPQNKYALSFMPDPQKAQSVVDKLIKLKKQTNLIDCSVNYLKLIKYYFANKKNLLRCYAGYISCMVDCYGNIHPCTIGSPLVANLKEISLKESWKSKKFNETRAAIKMCKRCYWNCWTELNLMFNKPKISDY